MTDPSGFATWINYILDDEGPELNQSPDEPGGASRRGVSVSALTDYNKSVSLPAATVADIINLTDAQATTFYQWFFSTLMLDQVPSAVAYRIADIVTNLGHTGGVEALGIALGIYPVPTEMTPAIVSMVNAFDQGQLLCSLSGVWLENKHADEAGWLKYGAGWTSRRNKAHARAMGLLVPAKATAPAIPAPVWPLQSQCLEFYGDPRGDGNYNSAWLTANIVHVACPWPLYFGKQPMPFISIHKKCADSLTRVLNSIYDAVNKDNAKITALKYDQFSGSIAYRDMRGSTAISMHEFGAAIDFDDADNLFHDQKHLFQNDSLIVVKFKAEGAVWGGDWSPGSVDAMHFQFARIG